MPTSLSARTVPLPLDRELDKAAVAGAPVSGVLEQLGCSEQRLTEAEVVERRTRYRQNV